MLRLLVTHTARVKYFQDACRCGRVLGALFVGCGDCGERRLAGPTLYVSVWAFGSRRSGSRPVSGLHSKCHRRETRGESRVVVHHGAVSELSVAHAARPDNARSLRIQTARSLAFVHMLRQQEQHALQSMDTSQTTPHIRQRCRHDTHAERRDQDHGHISSQHHNQSTGDAPIPLAFASTSLHIRPMRHTTPAPTARLSQLTSP
jgi:hypothetical protein